ncbi:signal peptidase I [Symbiobacterium terraclitae]|uniref:signal peptidase I n=1 Tax=Symbiobacterium terraclitae TaxID=557451 RepID=UPI0035B54714
MDTLIGDVVSIAVSGLLAWLLANHLAQMQIVNQSSMYPTLAHGDCILVNRLAPRYRLPERGEIVVFADPQRVEKLLVKRVIGLPGDTVEIRNGLVLVNGEPFPVTPAVHPVDEDLAPVTIQPGQLYVMGDNRSVSLDSRDFGAVSLTSVEGFAYARVWPLDRVGVLDTW